MPDFTSRHRLHRVAALHRRMAALTHELDVIPDRRAPMPPALAQRGWRVIDDVRDALRLTPVTAAERGKMPFDLVRQIMLVSDHLIDLRALGLRVTPGAKQKSYARGSRPHLQ